MALSNELIQAVNRYGPSVSGVAKRYGISGEALLAKLIQGESGGRRDQTSSAGAKGYTQFMPGTRQEVLSRYGIDPWGGPDEAVHAAALHLRGKLGHRTGLEGYNPGSSSYPSYILGQRVGDVHRGGGSRSSGGGSSGGSTPVTLTAQVPTPENTFDPGQGSDLSALAGLLQQPPVPPPVQAPQAPNSSQRYLSSAGTSPVVTPPVPQQNDLGALLAAIQSPGEGLPEVSRGSESVSVSGSVPNAQAASTGARGGSGGSVRLSDSANRPGVGLTPGIEKVLRTVSARIGHPLTVGTGTRHNRLTVDGNVSDHWAGNAADLPTSPGSQNIRLGRNALIALGVPAAEARRASGGIYNLPYGRNRRIQVIFNTNKGGNHHDHVHIGVTAAR